MSSIQVLDKEFVPFISKAQIAESIQKLAKEINQDFEGKKPLFLGVLNGSFMFASDLFKEITIDAEITFIKLASYIGTESSGNVLTTIGLDKDLEGRHLIIVEDIIDTGRTMTKFLQQLENDGLASISIATLLIKPEALAYNIQAKYVGFSIENKFVVGYGLDYDGYGRNIPEIYQIKE